jgi:hypothetical protein
MPKMKTIEVRRVSPSDPAKHATKNIEVCEFSSIDDAVRHLGTERALELLQYAYELTERSKVFRTMKP